MITGIIIVAILAYGVMTYNKIIGQREQVVNNESQISIQLDTRGKKFDSLISAVKKAMDYEKTTLKEIIELRTKATEIKDSALSNSEKQELEEELSQKISSNEFSKAFSITVEAYPELKANDNLMQLQEEIVSTENKLAYSKQAFNDSIAKYNATIASVPDNLIVAMFKGLKRDFSYWKLTKDKVKTEEDRRVNFD